MAGSNRLNCPFPNQTATKEAGAGRLGQSPRLPEAQGIGTPASSVSPCWGDLGQVPSPLRASVSSSGKGAAGQDAAGGPSQPGDTGIR